MQLKKSRTRPSLARVESLDRRVLFAAATVNFNDVRQTIDGFGAQPGWGDNPNPPDSALALAYSQTNGIGLSYIRGSLSWNGYYQITGMAQRAAAYGVQNIASPRGPAVAWLKNYGDANNGYLDPAHYQDYANMVADYLQNSAAQGVPVTAVSMAVEPDLITAITPRWTGEAFGALLPFFANTFRSRGITTKIMVNEDVGWTADDFNKIMADPSLSQYVDIIADHAYGQAYNPYTAFTNTMGKPVWMTENIPDTDGTDIQDGLAVATDIHNAITVANVSAYLHCFLNFGGLGLMDNWTTPTKKLWAMGNFSKFVRPGWVRVGETDDGGLSLTTFKDPVSGKFAVVAINSGASDVTETYTLNGLTAGSVTPYTTSISLNLAAGASIPIAGGTFSATIPASSIVTYYGQSVSAPALQAPVRLSANTKYGAHASQIALSWTDNSSSETGFTVERSVDGSNWTVVSSAVAANATTFVDTGLTENKTYSYRVKTNNGSSSSAYSNVATGYTVLAAPGNVTNVAQSNGNKLSWTRNSVISTGVTVQRSTDGLIWTGIATLSSPVTTYTDTISGYNAKQIYWYRVRNMVGPQASAYASYNTPVSTPTGFSATLTSPTSVNLAWTNTAVGAYAAYIRQNGSAISSPNLSIDYGTYPITGLTENTAYTFNIQAFAPDAWYRPSAGIGYGAQSGTATTTITTPVALPTALAAVSTGGGTAAISWADSSAIETAYQVDRSTDGSTWTTLTSTLAPGTATYTDPAAPTSGAVYYRVRAVVSATVNSAYAVTQAVAALATISGTTPVTGKIVSLTATPPAGFGTGTLTYTWSLDGTPPDPVTYSANGTAAAATTAATFARAGTYTFRVTITDASGRSTTAIKTIVVSQVATTITVLDNSAKASFGGPNAATPSIANSTWQQLSATAYDQFGDPLMTVPAFSWSVLSGGGSVSSSGFYTAPATTAMPVVRVTTGAASGQITLNVVSSPQPVAAYAFNETGGSDLTDTGTAGVTSKKSGNATLTAGHSGNAIDFDGSSGAVYIGRDAAVDIRGQITMSAWIKADSTSGTQEIISRGFYGYPYNAGTFLRIASGQYQVGYFDYNYRFAAVTMPASDVGKWVHLVGTYDGKNWNLYKNGLLAATYASSRGSTFVDRAWRVGSNDNGQSPTEYFNGKIDAVRLYGQALSAADVVALYTQPAITITNAAAATPVNTATNTSTLTVVAIDPDSGTDSLLSYTWSVTGKPTGATNPTFSINSTNAARNAVATFASPGLYQFTVTITDASGATATSQVNVVVPGVGDPTVAHAAAASPANVTGTTTTLSVLGADDNGEANLKYLWIAIGPAPVTYTVNGTDAAKVSTATFTAAGTYTFTAAITDANGQATTSSVVVTVIPTLTSIAVTPNSPLVNPGQTQQLAATGRDQFGNAMSTPAVAWAMTSGAGTVSTTGLYTAPATQGGLVAVQASGGGISGTAVLTVPMDNTDTGGAVTSSTGWTASTTIGTWFGSNYAYSNTVGNTYTYRPTVPVAGRYAVYGWWAADSGSRASNSAYDITSAEGTSTVRVNQKINNGQWVLLGTYAFNTGTAGNVTIRTPSDKDGSVIADGVRFQFVDPAATLVWAVSRKTGGAGRVDLPLSMSSASPTVEPRAGGPTSVVLTFSEPIAAADGTIDANEFAVSGATFVSAILSGVNLTVNLANVANASRVTVGLSGLTDSAGTALTGTMSITVRALAGDIDRNGAVNFNDFLVLQSSFGQANTGGLGSDLDGSGNIDFDDFLLLQTGFGQTVA